MLFWKVFTQMNRLYCVWLHWVTELAFGMHFSLWTFLWAERQAGVLILYSTLWGGRRMILQRPFPYSFYLWFPWKTWHLVRWTVEKEHAKKRVLFSSKCIKCRFGAISFFTSVHFEHRPPEGCIQGHNLNSWGFKEKWHACWPEKIHSLHPDLPWAPESIYSPSHSTVASGEEWYCALVTLSEPD